MTEMKPRTALILLDLQRDFLRTDGRMPIASDQIGGLLATVSDATTRARESGMPVAHIVNRFPRGSWLNIFRRHAAVEGSDGAELDDRAPRPGLDEPTFAKSKSDAFSNPELTKWLRDQGVERVVLCGVFANHCVRATALGALAAGLEVGILPDGVAAASEGARRRGLRSMEKKGCRVLGPGAELRPLASAERAVA